MTGDYAEVSYNVGEGGTGGILIDAPACYFEMSGSHAKIIGNQGGTSSGGGGIQIWGAGTRGVMSGEYAEISGNYSGNDGGGLYVSSNAQFTMSGGEITGNTCGAGYDRPQIAKNGGSVMQWAAGVQGWVRDRTRSPNDYCYTAANNTRLMDFADYRNYDITRIYVNGAAGSASSTIAVTGITLNPTSVTLYPPGDARGDSATLTATVTPANATNRALSWTSSNPTGVSVSSGVVGADGKVTVTVTALITGATATITASATDGSGITATCKVTVYSTVGSGGGMWGAP
jgi:uncharacterized protein YjdB